jgi:hypothetical protein
VLLQPHEGDNYCMRIFMVMLYYRVPLKATTKIC